MISIGVGYQTQRRGSRHNLTRDDYLLAMSSLSARGQELPQSKLLDIDVVDIRSAKRQRDKLLQHIKENLSNEALCKKYGIHRRTLEKILARETWTHLP